LEFFRDFRSKRAKDKIQPASQTFMGMAGDPETEKIHFGN